jgi:hypothetical protein
MGPMEIGRNLLKGKIPQLHETGNKPLQKMHTSYTFYPSPGHLLHFYTSHERCDGSQNQSCDSEIN